MGQSLWPLMALKNLLLFGADEMGSKSKHGVKTKKMLDLKKPKKMVEESTEEPLMKFQETRRSSF